MRARWRPTSARGPIADAAPHGRQSPCPRPILALCSPRTKPGCCRAVQACVARQAPPHLVAGLGDIDALQRHALLVQVLLETVEHVVFIQGHRCPRLQGVQRVHSCVIQPVGRRADHGTDGLRPRRVRRHRLAGIPAMLRLPALPQRAWRTSETKDPCGGTNPSLQAILELELAAEGGGRLPQQAAAVPTRGIAGARPEPGLEHASTAPGLDQHRGQKDAAMPPQATRVNGCQAVNCRHGSRGGSPRAAGVAQVQGDGCHRRN